MRRAKLFRFNGKKQSITEIAKHLNVSYITARNYLLRGYRQDSDVPNSDFSVDSMFVH